MRIKASELGDVDLGPHRVLAGAVSGSRAFDAMSALGLFSEGPELGIVLREYREAWSYTEGAPESLIVGPREYVMMTSSTLIVVCTNKVIMYSGNAGGCL